MSRWWDRAKCLGMDPTLFDLAGDTAASASAEALEVCTFCPVAKECFEDALKTRDWGVIRGGIPLAKPMVLRICAGCGQTLVRPRSRDLYRVWCSTCRPYLHRRYLPAGAP